MYTYKRTYTHIHKHTHMHTHVRPIHTVKRDMVERAMRTRAAMDALKPSARTAIEGVRPGAYVRMRFVGECLTYACVLLVSVWCRSVREHAFCWWVFDAKAYVRMCFVGLCECLMVSSVLCLLCAFLCGRMQNCRTLVYGKCGWVRSMWTSCVNQESQRPLISHSLCLMLDPEQVLTVAYNRMIYRHILCWRLCLQAYHTYGDIQWPLTIPCYLSKPSLHINDT